MTRRHPSRLARLLASVLVASLLVPTVASAHAPDPAISANRWSQDQVVPWKYRSGQVPPAWMAAAIEAAAADSNATRASRAATFSKAGSAASLIAYGEPTGCSALGIACFARTGSPPTSFAIWFRANGWVFDWGRLSWCQGPDGSKNGCFDVENVALDEFGHVLSLGHHVNYADQSDYLDAVVQTVSRARPAAGWNAHAYGRCDTARLQLDYDRPTPSSPFSTCLAIPSTMTLAASRTTIWTGESVAFTATLKTTTASANGALAGDPIAGRIVTILRRPLGSTAWTTIATMPATTTAGTYAITVSPTATYDWQAKFSPSAEGVLPATSPIVRVTLSSCSGPRCELRVAERATATGIRR